MGPGTQTAGKTNTPHRQKHTTAGTLSNHVEAEAYQHNNQQGREGCPLTPLFSSRDHLPYRETLGPCDKEGPRRRNAVAAFVEKMCKCSLQTCVRRKVGLSTHDVRHRSFVASDRNQVMLPDLPPPLQRNELSSQHAGIDAFP